MSEYIEVTPEESDDGQSMVFYTNLRLTTGADEQYHSLPAMEEGSPLAQALAVIPGIARLEISGQDLTLWREPGSSWYALVEDVTAVLKDFFL